VTLLAYVCYWGKTGQHLLAMSLSQFDPDPTSGELKSRSAAVSCRTEVCYPFGRKHGKHRAVKRRDFISLVGGAAAAWPLAAWAQQGERSRRVGLLIANYAHTDREGQANVAAFVDAFQRLGWTDGRNARIEYRWSAGDPERAKLDAIDLVRFGPDVIVVTTGPGLAELQKLTRTIPIVFAQVGDPVESGFVTSLARPGANITGFQAFEPAMGGKWLGVLKEAQPNLSRAAILFESHAISNVSYKRAAEAIAPSLGMTVTAVDVLDAGGIDGAIAAFANSPDGGLVVIPNRYTLANRGAIIVLAARHRVPAIYPYRSFAMEGGLLSYGFDQLDQWRGVASYVDRILRGRNPARFPFRHPPSSNSLST